MCCTYVCDTGMFALFSCVALCLVYKVKVYVYILCRDCGPLPESSFCHPVLQSSHVVTTNTHNLLDRVAHKRYNSTTHPLGIPYLNLTSEVCERALRLFLCMATYTPCSTSSSSNTVHSQYCGEINATTIFKKILDTCECTISGNCRQRIFAAVDGNLNFPVRSSDQINTNCLFLPDRKWMHHC